MAGFYAQMGENKMDNAYRDADSSLADKIQISQDKQRDADRLAKVLALCKTDSDGVVYRSKLDKVKCAICKAPRWEDGTRCKVPWCEAYSTQRFQADDEREG